MEELLRGYLPIIIFLGICLVIALALMLSAMIIAVRKPDTEKLSAYECGFDAFEENNDRQIPSKKLFHSTPT